MMYLIIPASRYINAVYREGGSAICGRFQLLEFVDIKVPRGFESLCGIVLQCSFLKRRFWSTFTRGALKSAMAVSGIAKYVVVEKCSVSILFPSFYVI